MISCLVLSTDSPGASPLAADLEAAGIHVIGAVQRGNLVQEVARLGPDVLICRQPIPDDRLFDALAQLAASAPRPVLLFTGDSDADRMAQALDAGVHAYVVNGYAASRLRSLIHLAQARFAREARLTAELADVSHRFEERKLVDRAKGILMRARQVSEEEAFRVLRAASMHSNQRVGQVSQHVISAAGFAEAVNRAGQLRMLSQRLIKLCALQAMSVPSAPMAQSAARIDATLAALGKSLSRATYGDLIDAVNAPWLALKALLATPLDAARLADADAFAEGLLLQADRLVATLESCGKGSGLQVINVAGRQRMLSQRFAAQALLAALLKGDAAQRAAAEREQAREGFERALDFLNGAPLTTHEIRRSLDEAGRIWSAMVEASARLNGQDAAAALAETSESVLALFEQLTERYERSMQVLVG